MSDTNYEKYGFSKSYVMSTKYCLQLLISKNEPPPEETNPDELDFLVHIKYDGDTLDDNILAIIEKASNIITRRAERDPEGETTAYKIRIDTSKTVPNSNIYIRDEKKDFMPYMSISGILMRLIKEVLDDLDAMDENEEDDDEHHNSDDMSE
jgi:hypothetical protein